jgi:DNA-binding CsgD family transcriptional regulator
MTAPAESQARCTRAQAAQKLRAEARLGRLDASAVELVLGAVGHRPRRQPGPAGLTAREVEVLVLIATGASAKQVAYVLGIAPKTASTHIERI